MKNMRLYFCITLGGLLLRASTGVAEDLMPPAWRGQPGSAFAQWTFSTSNSWLTPEVYTNAFGTPGGMVAPEVEWFQLWGGREGVWSFGGADISIPPIGPINYRFQITWAARTPEGHPYVALSAPANIVSGIELEPTGAALPFGEHWMHTTLDFQVLPGYESPWFTVGGDIMIDEMIVDTIVPEPGVLALWLLGGFAFALRSRQRFTRLA